MSSDGHSDRFQNLGILFVGKKEVPEILFRRKLDEIQALNPAFIGEHQLSEVDRQRIREESEREAKDLNLNSVKICFEALVYENDMTYPICSPVFSRPVANQSDGTLLTHRSIAESRSQSLPIRAN